MVKLTIGERVTGTYLGHNVAGEVKDVTSSSETGQTRYNIRLDEPIDVVKSEAFSSYRQNLSLALDQDGHSLNHESERDGLAFFEQA